MTRVITGCAISRAYASAATSSMIARTIWCSDGSLTCYGGRLETCSLAPIRFISGFKTSTRGCRRERCRAVLMQWAAETAIRERTLSYIEPRRSVEYLPSRRCLLSAARATSRARPRWAYRHVTPQANAHLLVPRGAVWIAIVTTLCRFRTEGEK